MTTAMFTPKGWLHCILYVLFENAMGIVKMGAVVAGECSSSALKPDMQYFSCAVLPMGDARMQYLAPCMSVCHMPMTFTSTACMPYMHLTNVVSCVLVLCSTCHKFGF